MLSLHLFVIQRRQRGPAGTVELLLKVLVPVQITVLIHCSLSSLPPSSANQRSLLAIVTNSPQQTTSLLASS